MYGLSISELDISDTMISDQANFTLIVTAKSTFSGDVDRLSQSYSSKFHLNFNVFFNELSYLMINTVVFGLISF